ncbi:p-loop nucleoside triphosphate hydrolase superfamily protein [Quillaja saponaria]|uniref:P-loop nucleoside triphosphate hydrolase superfamily protein n=1 Tax=Quillaja saponaria TaxID=32244 RepID=A0AAD7LSL0_QUISA|nr:p-loop nucleoside triphosphate hydrolase superfamily protein [Quillaja saponaria]
MAKKHVTRRELLDRWRGIEEEEENDDDGSNDSSKRCPLHQQKEQWFADAFNFLICLPKESHIWCGFWDLMGPLLETFYNYCKDERQDSPLRRLWKRVSDEMKQCIQCISQHHQAQDMYNMEYESSSIGPLLNVLQRLDEERVTLHLKVINARISKEEYHPSCDNAEVVTVLYEVLMFPVLLNNQLLFTEFELFVEAMDNKHELALDGHHQLPGVYALFFFKRSVRSVGHRLAGSMGKLRRAADLEPLQPLLKKFIDFLETEALPSTVKTLMPKAQLDRATLWIGIKSLLGFLEPPAFEEGILEHYPIFLDIVLNHISGDSLEFSHAVTCLRLLFQMLGYKLWLRSTLSPSVMRNTLLGQCFHTRNEKIHKDIFDLFQPLLLSLEALQDGEHEKQRRHFLYFLLHQVPVSSNFSILTRKLACQIALLIVNRGYKMNPPCPPSECAHMWGPSLVSSLKDSSLHSSLRQPAFDLIQTMVVSDATALIYSMLDCRTPTSVSNSMSIKLYDDKDDNLPILSDSEEKDNSSWSEFTVQSKITSQECREWMCIPMLWIEVLVEVDPSVLPISFSKAVFWARSRFPMVIPENSAEMALPVRHWLSSYAAEISSSFGWKVPTGSDDGGDGNISKNSVDVLTMSLPLIRTFNRLTAHYLIEMGKGELRRQWTWEPQMGECLILALLDPNDIIRQFGKCILEQVSDTRGLSCGLRFLCSYKLSLSATLLGLRHATKLAQLDSVILKFQSLHHFLFILCKLLKGDSPASELPEDTSNDLTITFSSQGGFLRQPAFDSSPVDTSRPSSDVEIKSQERFSYLLSEMAWPFVRRYLIDGKEFIDYNFCQMTCVRLLEILPVLFERLYPPLDKELLFPEKMMENMLDFRWLHDLIDWGRSSLKVVVVYWKRAITSLLNLLKGSSNSAAELTIVTIENLISHERYSLEKLMEQVSRLSVLLSREGCSDFGRTNLNFKSLSSINKSMSFERGFAPDVHPSSLRDTDVQLLDSPMMTRKKNAYEMIFLSDDEMEPKALANKDIPSDTEAGHCVLDGKKVSSGSVKSIPHAEPAEEKRAVMNSSRDSDNLRGISSATSLITAQGVGSNRKESTLKSENGINLNKFSDKAVSAKRMNVPCSGMVQKTGDPLSNACEKVLNDIVRDSEDDPLETALESTRRQPLHVAKPVLSVSRRQVIQLKTPVENRPGRLHRLEAAKRFKPPRLDDWYKSILEIDYFSAVGLASARKDENRTPIKLKKVPVYFQSPEQYVKIFQPLVLEEFKAQLHSSFLEISSWEEILFGSLSVMSIERVDDFHLVRFVHDDSDSAGSKSFSENDLVLLTKDPPQKSSHDVHMVGKVERREKDNRRSLSVLVIRFYFQNGSLRLNLARRNLIERSKWKACRIMNITSQLREFQALSSIKDIPLLPVILNPVNDSLCHNKSNEIDMDKLPQPLQQILRSSFNDSQLQAISNAIGFPNLKKDCKLSLIQGPPGTGKTRTIVAIVGALLASPVEGTNGAKRPVDVTNSGMHISQTAAIARAWQDAALARQLNEDVQNKSRNIENSVRGRVLICAQSNAAVDELVSRISSQGLYGCNGKMYKPYLVRVGNAKTIHLNSLPFFIDTLVDQRLAEERMHTSDPKNELSVDSSVALRANLEKLVDHIRFYEAKRANLREGNSNLKSSLTIDAGNGDEKEMSNTEIELQLRKLYEQKKHIYKDLSSVQAREKKSNEEVKALRHKLRKSILREATIVVTTLSGCGGDLYGVCSESMFSSRFGSPSEYTLFDAVVIDEAAQALEPATLIPLQLLKSSGTKCVMVGDPKQLPATVLSNIASKFLYECSMFERLQRAGHPVVMLTEQYRMHPEICRFPSFHFYDNKLLNGCQMSSKSASFHETKGLGPYVFYDVIGGQEHRGKKSGALSLYNEHEADAAVEVLRFFKKRYPSEFVGGRIGIITPYKGQLSLLRSRFSSAFGSSIIADMEFNTVDGFQGREVDILLLSTVRASNLSSAEPGINSSGIGFVADVRRMNVALTRAKLSLWILGNARTLQSNHNWAALMKDAKERDLIVPAKMPYASMFRSAYEKIHFPENSDNYSRSWNHVDNAKNASQPVTRNAVYEKEPRERKKKYTASEAQCNNIGNGNEDVFIDDGEGAQRGKRNAKDDVFPMKKDLSCHVGNHDKQNSCNGKSVVSGKHVTGGKRKGKDKKTSEKLHHGKRRVEFKNTENNSDDSEQETGGRHKLLKMQMSERSRKSSEGDWSRSCEKVSKEYNQEESNVKSRCGVPNQVHSSEDLIAKRKQQREAVNAILCSSLISSKQSGTSMKVSTKRPRPSSGAHGDMKPKTRNARPDPSAQQ